jgi:hypothetical protein
MPQACQKRPCPNWELGLLFVGHFIVTVDHAQATTVEGATYTYGGCWRGVRVGLTRRALLPVYPNQQTSQDRPD